MQLCARIGAVLVVVVGVLMLVDWYSGNTRLRELFPGFGVMRPTTVLCLVLLAVAVLMMTRPLVARVLGGLVVALGALSLVEYAVEASLGVDTLLPGIELAAADFGPSGTRMGPTAAAALVILGASVALIGVTGRRTLAQRVAEVQRTLEETVTQRTKELAESAETLQALIRVAPVGLVQLDASGGLLTANETWMDLSGRTLHDSRGGGWVAAIHPDDVARVVRDWRICAAEGRSYEAALRVRRPDGRESWVQVSTTPLYGSSVDAQTGTPVITGHLASVTDITALRQIEARIEHLAFHDSLTGLPNRILLRDRLDQALLNAHRHGGGRWPALPRSRPFQGHQRHPWAPCR